MAMIRSRRFRHEENSVIFHIHVKVLPREQGVFSVEMAHPWIPIRVDKYWFTYDGEHAKWMDYATRFSPEEREIMYAAMRQVWKLQRIRAEWVNDEPL